MNLANSFLISASVSRGSVFSRSVVYVCSHDSGGAFGLIVNKPSDVPVSHLLKSLEIDTGSADLSRQRVLIGGPVKPEQVFILHALSRSYDVTIEVSKEVGVTLSRDILLAIGSNEAPAKMLFTFGYAGWDAGQLEDEICHNAWLTLPANAQILFDTKASDMLSAVTQQVGVDIDCLSDSVGHA